MVKFRGGDFLPFADVLSMARSLGLANRDGWQAWCREQRPRNVPANPHEHYRDRGWQDWGHWLGNGNQSAQRRAQQFLPFAEALAVSRSLGLRSQGEWFALCRNGMRPPTIPSNPHRTYAAGRGGGWQNWGH